jgi:hypothetical protein
VCEPVRAIPWRDSGKLWQRRRGGERQGPPSLKRSIRRSPGSRHFPDSAKHNASGRQFLRALFFLRGTCAPARRASERPIATACLRLFTFLPERPLRRVPRFRSCMARFTLRLAVLLLFAVLLLLVAISWAELFLRVLAMAAYPLRLGWYGQRKPYAVPFYQRKSVSRVRLWGHLRFTPVGNSIGTRARYAPYSTP